MKVVAIIGPSGSGKSTLVNELTAKHPGEVEYVKSYTTRPKRNIDDNSHVFVTESEFDALLSEGELLGAYEGFGHRYGLPKLVGDKIQIVLIRVPVAGVFKKMYPESVLIEIDADPEVLTQRLKGRNSHERINLGLIEKEITAGRQLADYVVVNDGELNKALEKLSQLIVTDTKHTMA